MKILLANKFYYRRGGDCIHTIQLKQLLEQHGHEVAVFSMRHPENIEHYYSSYWPSEVSFSNKSPKQLLAALQRPLGAKEVKRKWLQLLKDFQPDVVHLHNIHSQLSPIIAQLAKNENIPVIWTLHDHKLVCPAYLFMDNNGKPCNLCLNSPISVIKKKCIKGSTLASVLGYFEALKWNNEKLQEITDIFVCPSLFLKSNMIKGGFNSSQITHLYNFVEDEKFENEIQEKRINEAVYVGRISKEKGVHTLCEAFRKIDFASLVIIGDGPLRKDLELEFGSKNINFLGYQGWDTISSKLSKAAFLVLPSECYENNPLTLIESFALGTPVLGAKIGGIPELINPSNGMLFEAGNEQDLRTKLQLMLQKTDWNYQQISADAAKKFSAEKYYQQLMELYKQ